MIFRFVDGLVQLFECASFNGFVSNSSVTMSVCFISRIISCPYSLINELSRSIEIITFLLFAFCGYTSCN